MNILLLTQFFSTTRGGGEYVFDQLARKLTEKDHKIFVITSKVEEYTLQKNLQIVLVPPTLKHKVSIPSFQNNITYTINAIFKGLTIIKKENIDLIHSNNFSPAIVGSILSLLTSKPHITTVHDVFSSYDKDFWKQWKKQDGSSKLNTILTPFIEKAITKLKHDCIHTVSDTTKDDLLELGERKPIHIIYSSIDVKKINEITISHQFVYVGRLLFYKNLEVAIRAINIAKNTEPKIKLIIVGDGPHKKSLEDMVQNLNLLQHIEFKGYIDEQEKTKLIASSCALVFPSICEGFGLVILEAFAQEKPVLVSDIRPMSDIITNDVTGYVLDAYDEKVWAEHFLKIIHDDRKTKDMGKNGSELLITKYNQEIMYQDIMKMYNSVLSN